MTMWVNGAELATSYTNHILKFLSELIRKHNVCTENRLVYHNCPECWPRPGWWSKLTARKDMMRENPTYLGTHRVCYSTQQWVSFDSAKLQLRQHNWSRSTRWLVGPGMKHAATLQITAKHHSVMVVVPVEYWKHWEGILISVNDFSTYFHCSPYFWVKNTHFWLLCALPYYFSTFILCPDSDISLNSAIPQAGSSLRAFSMAVHLPELLCPQISGAWLLVI